MCIDVGFHAPRSLASTQPGQWLFAMCLVEPQIIVCQIRLWRRPWLSAESGHYHHRHYHILKTKTQHQILCLQTNGICQPTSIHIHQIRITTKCTKPTTAVWVVALADCLNRQTARSKGTSARRRGGTKHASSSFMNGVRGPGPREPWPERITE